LIKAAGMMLLAGLIPAFVFADSSSVVRDAQRGAPPF